MSGLRTHRPAALFVAAATALALAACGGGSGGGGSGASGGSVKEGGVFRLGTSSTIDSLNPFIAFQSDADTAFEYIYPTLVQYTPSLKIVENFARSWKTSPDGRTWTFTTQPHAKWSDGKPLTAADAAWTFSTILKFADSATANSAGYVAHMKSATAPDATTLVLTYSQPVGRGHVRGRDRGVRADGNAVPRTAPPVHPAAVRGHARPVRDEEVTSIGGAPPRLDRTTPGCPFQPRCDVVLDRCAEEHPALRPVGPGHEAACHHTEEHHAERVGST